ncbi:MAG: FAD binding domain-containing protein [Dehalococcoidaceae bacterium]|nr:FAD binding domain-containing protein [Dehalococcoidaceae bacterium]
MKDIKHFNATSINDAAAKLAEAGSAPIAGGTDLVTILRAMVNPNSPDTIVNLKTIPDMAYIREEGDALKIGALATLSAIAASSVVRGKWAALAQAAHKVGSPQLRNAGTIGGNICQETRCWYYRTEHNYFACLKKNQQGLCYALTGDNRYHSIFGATNGCVCVNPSDTAPALVAFGATIKTNKRDIAAADFFDVKVAPNKSAMTVLGQDEIVTEISVPAPASGAKSAFVKFALRRAIDFPIVNCAAVIGGGSASIVLNAVAGKPRKVTAAEQSIAGKTINEANAAAAAEQAATGTLSIGKNKYMIQLAKAMVKKAILACA